MAIIYTTDGRGRRRLWATAVILSGMLSVCGLFPGGSIVCEAKEPKVIAPAKQEKSAAAGEEQEVVTFVTAYRKAASPEGIDTLPDYVDDPDHQDVQTDLLRNQVSFKLGIKGWENVRVVVRPMSDGQHWVASVSGDLLTENFDFGIPGLNVVLVCRNEKGELKIMSDDVSECTDTFLKEVRELYLSDEIQEHSNEIALAYNTLLAEHPEVIEWAESTNMAIEEELGKMLEERLPVKTDAKEKNIDAKKQTYTVQKGDCLWNIAQEYLGDGMRWSSLYERNKDVIGDTPDLLYVGITLQLN